MPRVFEAHPKSSNNKSNLGGESPTQSSQIVNAYASTGVSSFGPNRAFMSGLLATIQHGR